MVVLPQSFDCFVKSINQETVVLVLVPIFHEPETVDSLQLEPPVVFVYPISLITKFTFQCEILTRILL